VFWSKRFDEPIVLGNGTTLRTLREAIAYLVKTVPSSEREHEGADRCRSPDPVSRAELSRAATLRAIHRNDEQEFAPDRKDHHWGKRKLKRDQ